MFSQLKNYGKKQTNIYLKVELQSVGWPWDVSGHLKEVWSSQHIYERIVDALEIKPHLKCRGGEINPNINSIDTNTDIGIGFILAQ